MCVRARSEHVLGVYCLYIRVNIIAQNYHIRLTTGTGLITNIVVAAVVVVVAVDIYINTNTYSERIKLCLFPLFLFIFFRFVVVLYAVCAHEIVDQNYRFEVCICVCA